MTLGSFQQLKLTFCKKEGPGSSPGREFGHHAGVVVALKCEPVLDSMVLVV